jgi:hypothetical protein
VATGAVNAGKLIAKPTAQILSEVFMGALPSAYLGWEPVHP